MRRVALVAVLVLVAVAWPGVAHGSENGLSRSASLSPDAYAGLACDVFDPALRKAEMPNGVGPEARAAAACVQLAWKGGSQASRPIKVMTSPGFPKRLLPTISRGIKAGDRLFGGLGSANRTYTALFSVDPKWSCTTGAAFVDARAIGRGQQFKPWAQDRNSGCPGADYAPFGWEPKALGDDGSQYFVWSLAKPQDARYGYEDPSPGSPLWSLRAISHDFVHAIQMQRSSVNPNGLVTFGQWWGEGQAQYLGYAAAQLSSGPKDLRTYQLQVLRRDMKKAGLRQIRIQDLETAYSSPLVFSAGYFAYEYMLAHYGLARTFDFWDEWNRAPCATDSRTCWQSLAPEMLGVDAETLLESINNYVNAQVQGS